MLRRVAKITRIPRFQEKSLRRRPRCKLALHPVEHSRRLQRMGEKVTILGDGAMATVCSILLTQGGHAVTMWGAFEESIERLMQDREQRRLLPGVRVPPNVQLTGNDGECFAGST